MIKLKVLNVKMMAIVFVFVFVLSSWQSLAKASSDSFQLYYIIDDTRSKEVGIYLYNTENVTINWGDQSSNKLDDKDSQYITHKYTKNKAYMVKISGTFKRFVSKSNDNLSGLISFGDVGLESLENAFADEKSITFVPSELPSSVTNLMGCFMNTGKTISGISNWDVSNVSNMSLMFYKTENLNPDISKWNVSNVKFMLSMFKNAQKFNRDISGWDVSNVTHMSGMFSGAESFDQDLSSWDISKVTDLAGMFAFAKLSTKNIDKIVNTWVNLPNLPHDLKFGTGKSEFSHASYDARKKLEEEYGWTINGVKQGMVLVYNVKAGDKVSFKLKKPNTFYGKISWGTSYFDEFELSKLSRYKTIKVVNKKKLEKEEIPKNQMKIILFQTKQ